jgi:hypothetical protein
MQHTLGYHISFTHKPVKDDAQRLLTCCSSERYQELPVKNSKDTHEELSKEVLNLLYKQSQLSLAITLVLQTTLTLQDAGMMA